MITSTTKKTGLFFGSFNPIHIGHLMIAKFMLEFTDLTEVWFVISPHNPLKKKSTLLADHHRLALVKTAIENEPKFKACDIEFEMPQPSFTIDTLTYLFDKYPEKKFVLISGSDIFPTFHKVNSKSAIKKIEGFRVVRFDYISDLNYTRKWMFLIFLFLHLISRLPGLSFLRTNILAVLEKTD